MIDDVDLRLILAFVLLRGENSFGSFEFGGIWASLKEAR